MRIKKVGELFKWFVREPKLFLKALLVLPDFIRGLVYSRDSVCVRNTVNGEQHTSGVNPLRVFFDNRKTGRGIWKWIHYFDIYHKHLGKFVGRKVNIVEIGIYSGGSLEMWRDYFGPNCRVYGIDIETACKGYENDYTKVYIGDQENRSFWKNFVKEVPAIDIIIDDGGHMPNQQMVTLEELLPYLSPGGVYVCEDVHKILNGYAAFMAGLSSDFNAMRKETGKEGFVPNTHQQWISSIHTYPFVTVIEKNSVPVEKLHAPKHGTEWQPFIASSVLN